MTRSAKAVLAATIIAAGCGISLAAEFPLGEETGGIKVQGPEGVETTIRIMVQPRFDRGDLAASEDGTRSESESDFFLRRLRIETDTSVTPRLRLNFGFGSEGCDQMDRSSQLRVRYAFADYRFAEAVGVRLGRDQLPLSRIVITNTAKLLLLENPASMEAAKKLFNEDVQPQLRLYGAAGGGTVAYVLAAADGWEPNAVIYGNGADNTVEKSGPVCIARLELSPPGWVEKWQSDAPMGRGRHLKAGAHYAAQRSIAYKGSGHEEDRTLWGVDLSGHRGGIVVQAEYAAWSVNSTSPARGEVKPRGWYVQAGYLIPGAGVEPCARYEVYDTDSGKPDARQKIATAGVNWYLKGHSFQLGINWARTDFGRNAAGAPAAAGRRQDSVRLQAQIYM